MADTAQKEPAEALNLDIDLDRTTRPESKSSDLIWDGDLLKYVGMWQIDCSAFKVLEPETQQSLRDHLISFALQQKYSMSTFKNIVHAIAYALVQHPTSDFDLAWLVKSITLQRVAQNIALIRSFFIYWQDRHPQAITNDALLFLVRLHTKKNYGKNVSTRRSHL